jgi:hypothetical protein
VLWVLDKIYNILDKICIPELVSPTVVDFAADMASPLPLQRANRCVMSVIFVFCRFISFQSPSRWETPSIVLFALRSALFPVRQAARRNRRSRSHPSGCYRAAGATRCSKLSLAENSPKSSSPRPVRLTRPSAVSNSTQSKKKNSFHSSLSDFDTWVFRQSNIASQRNDI